MTYRMIEELKSVRTACSCATYMSIKKKNRPMKSHCTTIDTCIYRVADVYNVRKAQIEKHDSTCRLLSFSISHDSRKRKPRAIRYCWLRLRDIFDSQNSNYARQCFFAISSLSTTFRPKRRFKIVSQIIKEKRLYHRRIVILAILDSKNKNGKWLNYLKRSNSLQFYNLHTS